MVAVTVTLDMDIEEFFAEEFVNNLALLLGISEDRIRIVSVTAGVCLLLCTC